MQSFLDRPGTEAAIFSHLSGVFTGYVFRACSRSFCSSVVQGDESVNGTVGKKSEHTKTKKIVLITILITSTQK